MNLSSPYLPRMVSSVSTTGATSTTVPSTARRWWPKWASCTGTASSRVAIDGCSAATPLNR